MKQFFLKASFLASIILMDILGGAEIDIFVPSFPELKSEFNLSPLWVEALLSANFIGYVLSLLFVGSLGDRYGRRQIIIIGLLIFIIGSLFCTYALSYKFLIIGRFLQGIGVAAPAILSFVIIADSYSLKEQQYFLAMLNAISNISVAIAPLVGSYLTIYFHWQGNFYALLIMGVITLIFTLFFVPQQKLITTNDNISLQNFMPIFSSKDLRVLIAHLNFTSVPYWLFLGMSPILYMEAMGVSLAHYGYYQGAWALIYAVGSIFAGSIICKYPAKKLLNISYYGYIISLLVILFVTYNDSKNPLLITLAFQPLSIVSIIPATLLYPLSINYIPEIRGKIAATIQGTKLILTAISIEIAGYFYAGSFQNVGIIICVIILGIIVTLNFILKNKNIMKILQADQPQAIKN